MLVAFGHRGQHDADSAVAPGYRDEIGVLVQRLLPSRPVHRVIGHLVTGVCDQGGDRFRGMVFVACVRVVQSTTNREHLQERREGEPTVRILIVNDDGIYSPGIAALTQVARRFGEIRVVAPDVEQSSAGHAITATRPVRSRPTRIFDGIDAYRVNGTPADCVALGIFQWQDVDVVLSGVNLGSNLGNATWHSGTLAAAKQATLLGIRGIALSAPASDEEPNFEPLSPWLDKVLEMLLDERCPQTHQCQLPARPERHSLDIPGSRPI